MSHRAMFRSRLAVSVLAIVVAAAVWAAPAGMEDLAGPLKALVAAGGAMGTASAQRAGVVVRGDQVAVTVLFRSEAGAAATSMGRFGGRTAARHDRRVEAMLPVDRLLEVAALPQVAQITPTPLLVPLQGFGATSSQGVQLTSATAFHLAGNFGDNVKIAVIDTGFAGLPAEVPVDPVTDVLDYRLANGPASGHGTAVAEIIADMAPAADMTLIMVDTPQSVEDAIDYVIAQRFPIVNMSLGLPEGPFDGTHPLSQAVNRARAAGVLWINSAGNWARQHWQGNWQDNNSDGFSEFSGTKDTLAVTLNPGTFSVYLSWFETAGAETDHDYDLVLVDALGGIVARSSLSQNGDDPPKEQLLAFIATAGQYRLKIQGVTPPAPGETPDKFQLFSPGFDIETTLQHAEDSLAIPAEATGSLSVGATRGVTTVITGAPAVQLNRIEPFSSRGSIGSTLKPDMVAPDGVVTSVAGFTPFLGTSAAAPHVAGAAALLLAEDSGRTATTLRNLLSQMSLKFQVPADIPVTDINAYGFGRLDLRVGANADGDAPVVRIEFPLNNSTITVASPHVVASITDNSGVNPDTIQVWFDNQKIVEDGLVVDPRVTDYLYDDASGALTLVLNDLTRTRHSLSMQASDFSDNQSELAVVNFRIATPTISAGLHIISLPYPGMAGDDPAVVFGVPLEQLALLRWVPGDSRFSKYHIYPDDFASFAPPDQLVPQPPAGLGYFLSLPTTGTLNISAGGVTTDSYNISLVYGTDPPRGWNLIGNPYESYVDWGSVEFISANGRQDLREAIDDPSPVTEGVLFKFVSSAGGGYYSFESDPTQATLEPLKGYWLHVLKNATLVVNNAGSPEAASAAADRPRPAAAAPAKGNWTLQLQARAGQYEDPINYVGVSSAASDGYDVGLDVSEPPPLVDSLRLYMPSSAGNLARDTRSATGDRQEWDVEVACRLAKTPISVSWPTLNASVPRELTVRLEDADTGASVYMRTANAYTFQMAEPGVRRLRIVASRETGSALALTGVSAAAARSGQVTFTYAVSRQADVSVEIRNISGALIRNLGQRDVAPGTAQTVVWNAQNTAGLRVPSGRYLARITARAADGQSVQTIHPFQVSQ